MPTTPSITEDDSSNSPSSVSVDSTGLLQGGFFYEAITPVTLVAGQRYTIGAMYASDDLDSYFSGPSSMVPNGISATVAVAAEAGDLGFVYPVTESAGNLGRIGPNALVGVIPVELMTLTVE